MSGFGQAFARFSTTVSRWAGRPPVFAVCCLLVVLWALSGPMFGFSDTWQLVINTSTTIITFLMVFLIQNTQNRDNNAIHAKLDELIRIGEAENALIGIENLPDEQLEKLLKDYDEISTELREEALAKKMQQGAAKPRPSARKKAAPAAKRARA